MKQAAMLLIRFYRKVISPLLPRCCKYYPSYISPILDVLHKIPVFRLTYL